MVVSAVLKLGSRKILRYSTIVTEKYSTPIVRLKYHHWVIFWWEEATPAITLVKSNTINDTIAVHTDRSIR